MLKKSLDSKMTFLFPFPIRGLLYEMVASGFILFQPETESIIVKDRLVHFADAAQSRRDYDILRFYSKTDGTNAKLEVKSQQILANEIKTIEFSDRHKVAARPHEGQLVLKKDRNLSFDGKVFAGYSSFEGKDFDFEYHKNQLTLDSVRYFDSVSYTHLTLPTKA